MQEIGCTIRIAVRRVLHSTGESGQRIETGPCLIWVDVENPFRAEWLFKPRLIQATARLDRQLLSEETQTIFAQKHLAGCTTRYPQQHCRSIGRSMVNQSREVLLGESDS
jgi:hypothetical protein